MPLDRLIESRRDRGSAGFARFLPAALVIHGVVVCAMLVQGAHRAPPAPTPPLKVTFEEPLLPTPPPPAAPALKPAASPPSSRPPAPETPQVVEPVIPEQPTDPEESTQENPGEAADPAGVAGGQPGGVIEGMPSPATTRLGPLRIGGDVTAPELIRQVDPEYPALARRAHVVGEVFLEAVIRRDGTVGQIRVVQGLRMGCTEAAVDALKRWRFRPGMQRGVPVDVIMELKVTFRLE